MCISDCKEKVSLYAEPAAEMDFPRLNAVQTRSNGWRIEHDRLLVLATVQMGYGDWSKLRRALLRAPEFRLDYFLRSRTPNDINKRIRQLRPSIERELGVNIRVFDRDAKPQQGLRRRQTEQRRKLRRHLRFLQELEQELQQEGNQQEESAATRRPSSSKRSASELHLRGAEGAPPAAKRRRVRVGAAPPDEESTAEPDQELPTPPPIMRRGVAQRIYLGSVGGHDGYGASCQETRPRI